jgi:hypothetical protein
MSSELKSGAEASDDIIRESREECVAVQLRGLGRDTIEGCASVDWFGGLSIRLAVRDGSAERGCRLGSRYSAGLKY